MRHRIGLVAGEASGDRLAAGLMRALAARLDRPRFVGVGGGAMLRAGLQAWAELDALAVNGFKDPLVKLPRLLRLWRRLRRQLLEEPVDLFIGVDFNVFNLLLEGALKRAGVPTVHYVSPSVYAWRRRRIHRVGRSADLLLALFPFEPALYADTDLPVVFVGHPLADAIPLDGGSEANRRTARAALGLAAESSVLALLPGSRVGEVRRHIGLMLEAAAILDLKLAGAAFVIPCPSPRLAAMVEQHRARWPKLRVQICRGDARQALTACDGALVKSGTGTLEAMLLRRPMVVTYRLGALSHALARLLMRAEFVGLPNLLAGRELAPELLQRRARAEDLAATMLKALDKTAAQEETLATFATLHRQLRRGADARAAEAVMSLLTAGRGDALGGKVRRRPAALGE